MKGHIVNESGFVYRWHDRKRNRYYFGSHWGCPDDGYVCGNRHMKAAFKKRPETFAPREILVVVTTSRKDLHRHEQYWLDRIHPSQLGRAVYNLKLTAEGGCGPWSDESRAKLSASLTNPSVETLAKRAAGNTGLKRSAETLEKLRVAWLRRKEQRWTHSAESREKMRVAATGRKRSAEAIEKTAAGHRGKKRPPRTHEWCMKLSANHISKQTGDRLTEWRAKQSIAHKGKKHSIETREKMIKTRTGMKRGSYKLKGVMNVAECEAA